MVVRATAPHWRKSNTFCTWEIATSVFGSIQQDARQFIERFVCNCRWWINRRTIIDLDMDCVILSTNQDHVRIDAKTNDDSADEWWQAAVAEPRRRTKKKLNWLTLTRRTRKNVYSFSARDLKNFPIAPFTNRPTERRWQRCQTSNEYEIFCLSFSSSFHVSSI